MTVPASTSPYVAPETTRSPWLFFLVVVALAAPLWVIGAISERGLLSGRGVDLPFSALTFVCPILAALILVYRQEGSAGLRRFTKRVFDAKGIRPRLWYAPIVLLLPLIYSMSYGIMRVQGRELPSPQTSVLAILVLSGIFLVSATCEEAGWTGYAIDPLQARWGALGASIIVGVVWAVIHVVPDAQADKTGAWIAGQRCFSIALRILIVWLYNNTGRSVPAAILFHTMDNVSVYTLFPDNGGGNYEPAITAALTAVAAVIVLFLWGPRTLRRFRFAGSAADNRGPTSTA